MNKCRILFLVIVFIILAVPVFALTAKQPVVKRKILVVYYSRSGNTARVAKSIASALEADLEALVDQKNRNGFWGVLGSGKDAWQKKTTSIDPPQYNPSNYDLVIIGTPTWAWEMTPAIRTYLTQYPKAFKNLAVFTTSGDTDPKKIVGSIEKLTGKTALAYAGFSEKDLKNVETFNTRLSEFEKQLH